MPSYFQAIHCLGLRSYRRLAQYFSGRSLTCLRLVSTLLLQGAHSNTEWHASRKKTCRNWLFSIHSRLPNMPNIWICPIILHLTEVSSIKSWLWTWVACCVDVYITFGLVLTRWTKWTRQAWLWRLSTSMGSSCPKSWKTNSSNSWAASTFEMWTTTPTSKELKTSGMHWHLNLYMRQFAWQWVCYFVLLWI